MNTFLSQILFALIAVITSGCMTDTRGVGDVSRLCDELSSAKTWETRKQILSELATQRNRTDALRTMVDGWGTRSENYDIAILCYLRLSTTDSIYQMDAAVASSVTERLRNDPRLLHQVFWNHRWFDGILTREPVRNVEPPEEGRVSLIYKDLFTCYRSDPEKFIYLIFLASMVDSPNLIENLSWKTVGQDWDDAREWLRENAAYLFFDKSRGMYRIDEIAKKQRVPIDPRRQEWTAPTTPLPPKMEENGTRM